MLRLGPAPHVGPPTIDRVTVDAVLAPLSPSHRAVLVLHYAVGLTVQEIARELGLAPGTVKSRLSRARAAAAAGYGRDEQPDAAQRLRRDLADAIAADIAATRTANPDAVRLRGRRRQRARGLLAVTAALAIGVGTAVTLGLAVRDDAVPSTVAAGGAAAPFLLDEGTAADGPWTLVVTEQNCLEHARPRGQGGVCGLDEAGRLQDVSSFRTEDDGQSIVIVNGTVEAGTSKVLIELAGRSAVQTTPVLVDGRLFFSARTPADARITGLVAVDDSGDVLIRVGELPPPPHSASGP